MKEMFESKTIHLFIIVILGITYIGADQMVQKNDSQPASEMSQVENLNK